MIEQEHDKPAESRHPELTELCQKHPLAYAGYRVSHLRRHDRQISETDEIPFLTSVFFPFVLIGYLAFVRSTVLKNVIFQQTTAPRLDSDGHVFSMTSTHGYRTHTFQKIATALQERGEDVVFLCSPVATAKRDTWEESGFQTVSHRELHPHVGLFRTLGGAMYALSLTIRLGRTENVDSSVRALMLYYNFTLLEFVKRESVRPLTRSNPAVHTFSPMPYLLETTQPDRVFVYQHGIQPPTGGLIMAAPFFVPLTYFLWGEPCRPHFEAAAHSDSNFYAVGSPWYEHLSRQPDGDDPRYDVLLVSETHRLVDGDLEADFERLVRTTVETCTQNGYSLVVKLHPLEDIGWYERHNLAEYVAEFDDIDDALTSVRVSVMDESSAFVESAALETPAIVSDLKRFGLDGLEPVDYVTFTNGPEVGDAIVSAMQGEAFRSERSRELVVTTDTTDRIVEQIDQERAAR